MTHGDDDKIKCPYCRLPGNVRTQTAGIRAGEIREFTMNCTSCGKPVHFWARLAVAVEAEQEGKVK